MKMLETTKPTAGKAIDTLVAAGVLQETTGRQRGREFSYGAYLAKLQAQ
jgi:cell filamentation protein, protein adenylyltransferase